MTPWFLLSLQKNSVGIWPQGIKFHKGTENFPAPQAACVGINSLLDETVHMTGSGVQGSTTTPGRTLYLWKMTQANNSQRPTVRNSSLHKVRLHDLLKHIMNWISSERKENPLPFEVNSPCFFPLTAVLSLSVRHTGVKSQPTSSNVPSV